MNISDLAKAFETLAFFLELKGENPFRIRAYVNAERLLYDLNLPLDDLLEKAEAGELKGFGKGLTEHILEFKKNGKLKMLEELRAEFPAGLLDLFDVPGLGAKKIRVLYEDLQIDSLKKLKEACEKHLVSKLPGFGDKTEQKILAGIEHLSTYAGRYLYSDAVIEAMAIVEYLRAKKVAKHTEIAGSLRRCKEVVKDIDIIATSSDPDTLMRTFTSYGEVASVSASGQTKSSVLLRSGIAVDLRVVPEDLFPFAFMHFTGSKEHNTVLRTIAKKKGYKLNEYGLFKGTKTLKCKTEEDIYAALGLTYLPPEVRENQGEVEVAEQLFKNNDTFPALIKKDDLRGILHVHSTYSDGKDTLESLARAAQEAGYEYLGLTDHSQSAGYAGGLKPDAVKRQHEEIDKLNAKLAPFKIFKGIESDILPDGSLDYKDSILEQFDFVIASVHSQLNLKEKEMTKRIINAVSNPYTTILGHISGRLLLRRESYAVDIPAVLKAASKHKVAVELNCNPQRLELDWRYLRQAAQLGINIPICPDAHSIAGFSHLRIGIGIARKGWLQRDNVLNCLSRKEFETYLNRKKGS